MPEVEDYLNLRPRNLSEYIGQKQVVETLEIAIQAAKKRGEPLDHILFHSPPGLGKTTLAHIIATELGVRIVTSSGPAIEKGGDLISILTHLERGDVLFIDEVHRLPKVVEEFLYPAMEDFCIDLCEKPSVSVGTVHLCRCYHTGRTSFCASSGTFWNIEEPRFLYG